MRVVWTRQALLRLTEIEDYIATDNPAAAIEHTEQLLDRATSLADNPRLGRRVPELDADDLRELVEGRYRIVYRVRGDSVQILTVFEGHRLFPTEDLPPPGSE
jgi:addiction module RelE/StbE family toxin